MKNIRLFIGLLLIIFFPQSPAFSQNPEWINFTNSNSIQSLAEEGNFIWVGTGAGLAVFREGGVITAVESPSTKFSVPIR